MRSRRDFRAKGRGALGWLLALAVLIAPLGEVAAETPRERYVACSNAQIIPIARRLGLPIDARLTQPQKVKLNNAVKAACEHHLTGDSAPKKGVSKASKRSAEWLLGEWYGGHKNVIIRLALRADDTADINFLVDRQHAGGGAAAWQIAERQLIITRGGVDLKFNIDFDKKSFSNEKMTFFKEGAAAESGDDQVKTGRVNGDIPEFRACVDQNGHRLQSWSIPRAVKWCCDRIGGQFYSSGGPLSGECRK